MNRIPQTSHFGGVYRVQKFSQPIEDKKKAAFNAQFSSARSSSLRAPTIQPERRRVCTYRTTNHVSAAPLLIQLLALGLIVEPAGTDSASHRSSLPQAFRGSKNVSDPQPFGRRSAYRQASKKNAPRRIPLHASAPPPGTQRSHIIATDTTNVKVMVSGRSGHPAAPPEKYTSTVLTRNLPRPPGAAQKGILSAACDMLHHRAADRYVTADSGGWPLTGVQAGYVPFNTQWASKIILERQEQKHQYALEKAADRRAFLNAINFNPFKQDFRDFIHSYLITLFTYYDVDVTAIDELIAADFCDIRHMTVASAHLQPIQSQPILYTAQWSLFDIVTGRIYDEIEKKAGRLTAHRGPLSIHWNPNFPAGLKKALIEGDVWLAFSEFMTTCLNEGELVDEAQAQMRSYLSGMYANNYKGPAEKGAAQFSHLVQNSRGVLYNGIALPGLFLGPPSRHDTFGTLYSVDNEFPPMVIESETFFLTNVLLRDIVKRALPAKTVATLGNRLFSIYLRGGLVAVKVTPQLTFSELGNVDNILWSAAISKLLSDMDFNVLSSDEKKLVFTVGLLQTSGKAALAMLGPVLGPWSIFAASMINAAPDAILSTIVDKPELAKAYLTNFFISILVETLGMSAFLIHRAILTPYISTAAHNVQAVPTTKDLEIRKLIVTANSVVPPKATLFATRVGAKAVKVVFRLAGKVTPIGSEETTSISVTPETTTDRSYFLQQAHRIRIDLLAEVKRISTDTSQALLERYDLYVIKCFTNLGIKTPAAQWQAFPKILRKMIAVKFVLEDNLQANYADGMVIATDTFERPPSRAWIDRTYFYALEDTMAARMNDTALFQHWYTAPSAELLRQLAIDTPERADAFLTELQTDESFIQFGLIKQMRSNLSPAFVMGLSQYNAEQITIFLQDYQEKRLLEPGRFYAAALFHTYIGRKLRGQEWHFDDTSRLETIVADYKRALGLEQAAPRMVVAIKQKLGHTVDRMALSGSHGRMLMDLIGRNELREIPGYSAIDYRKKIFLFEAMQRDTGLSASFPLGSLEASVDRMLTLFPDGLGLSAAAFMDGEALFMPLIGLDMAVANGVRHADQQWAESIWDIVFSHRLTTPGLSQWIDNLTQRYPNAPLDRALAAADSLQIISKEFPSPELTSELILFAKKMMKGTLREQRIGGNSPHNWAQSLSAYVVAQLGIDLPTTVHQWDNWLKARVAPGNDARSLIQRSPANPATVIATLSQARKIMGWPKNTTLPAAPPDRAAETWAWKARMGTRDVRSLPAPVLVMSGYKNIKWESNGIRLDVQIVANRATSVFELNGVWYDDNYRADKTQLFAQMLAKNIVDGSLYAAWPADVPVANLEVAGLPMSDMSSVQQLPVILDFLRDVPKQNGSALFDQIFILKQSDVAATSGKARALFSHLIDMSWLFLWIVDATRSYAGRWTIEYGQMPSINPAINVLFMINDDQLPEMPKDTTLNGVEQNVSIARLYVEAWLSIFLQQDVSRDENNYEPKLNTLLANVVLDQAGLLTYERLSDRQLASLPVAERVTYFNQVQWLSQYMQMRLTAIAPAESEGTTFISDAAERMTTTSVMGLLLSLPVERFPGSFFMKFPESFFRAIKVQGTENDVQEKDDIIRIFNELYANIGMFAQLVSHYRDNISPDHPWCFITLPIGEIEDELPFFGASHFVDHYEKIVYFVNLDIRPAFYLSANGPKLTYKLRELTIIWIKILLGIPNLNDAKALQHRGLAVALADICLFEYDRNSVPAMSGAIVDAADENACLQLSNSLMHLRRCCYDENAIIDAARHRLSQR